MKHFLIIILFPIYLSSLAQVNDVFNKSINITIIDNLTKTRVAKVKLDSSTMTYSDWDGELKLYVKDTNLVFVISKNNYDSKTIILRNEKKPLIIDLIPIPFDSEKKFIIKGEPYDTTYYKSGKIKQIEYTRRALATFYATGQKKSLVIETSYREWYINGKLKYQSIEKAGLGRLITKWYETGQIKECGTVFMGYKSRKQDIQWVKDTDWLYWDKKGNLLNKKK